MQNVNEKNKNQIILFSKQHERLKKFA